MKKEKRELVKNLKNKRKRLRRLKTKAAQLNDADLFDIVRARELKDVWATDLGGRNENPPEKAAEDSNA